MYNRINTYIPCIPHCLLFLYSIYMLYTAVRGLAVSSVDYSQKV